MPKRTAVGQALGHETPLDPELALDRMRDAVFIVPLRHGPDRLGDAVLDMPEIMLILLNTSPSASSRAALLLKAVSTA
ncbi:MAG: hypothetical protein IPM89_04900 [Candidatus Competibacteraceae bacterium]|nr:MAG: hypothetical protein IPM89_04900 [Candidatus Competibacteraceae bacterium]